MSSPETAGLRERKNARTRVAIERAAAELALEQGYDHTTVDQIAERADVAPRTVYVRYPSKEAILFGPSDSEDEANSFRSWIEGDEGDLVDRLAGFVQSRVSASQDDAELKRLKMLALWTDPYLRQVLRGKLDAAEQIIAEQLGRELGLAADDSGPRVLAAAIAGMFLTMGGRACDHPDSFDPIKECANGLRVLRAGLDALKPS
jgi:AcrR family transcriptional regulator